MSDTSTAENTSFRPGFRAHMKRRVRRGTLLLGFAVSVHLGRATDLRDVLSGIEQVESTGRDIGLHRDGVTYGRYGVTYMAVRELQRIGWLAKTPVDLRDPKTNRRVARLYLEYLKKRYGSWWHAVQHYNPRSKTYARKVWAAMDRRRQNAVASR